MDSTDKPTFVVQTKDGPVRGYTDKTDEGVYYKFKSIPYAKPPLGQLRFLPPSPISPWTEEIDCTQDAPYPMIYDLKQGIIGSEDCLYIHISTPRLDQEKRLPVMFWIGSFAYSYNLDNIIDPKLINNQDIVFVKCGFRLGPFGFLSINDFPAPGNSGLKDIVLALKWVKENIANFGGDPTNVSLFGTGGPLIHLMVLSPLASGLFHKAIIQSATALNNWAITMNPTQAVVELAKELKITVTDFKDIVEKMKELPAEQIMEAFKKICSHFVGPNKKDVIGAIFKPCVENEIEGQAAFLTKTPPAIVKTRNFNKVSLIVGSTNIEYDSVFHYLRDEFYANFKKYDDDVCLLVPKSLCIETKSAKRIGRQLLNFYLQGEKCIDEHNKTQYLQMISDYCFLYYVNKTVKLHSEYAPECPIYYYINELAGEGKVLDELHFFNYVGNCTMNPFLFGIKSHGKPSRDSIIKRNRIIKLWTNFAKYGNPTPDDDDSLLQITWDPVENKDKLNFLSVGYELTKGRNPFHHRMEFWDQLHRENTFLRVLVYMNEKGLQL